jgi:hypothetical protein
MLDLPHYLCNQVYVPWQSKGGRRTNTWQNNIGSSSNHDHLPYTDIRLVRGQAMDSTNAMSWVSPPLGHTIGGQSPNEQPGSSSQPLRVDTLLDEASLADQGEWSSGEDPRRTRRLHELMPIPSPFRCASPEHNYSCDGWCQYSEVPSPNVVSIGVPFRLGEVVTHIYWQLSLSACSDSQRAWEGPRGSLTTILCSYLGWCITSSHCGTLLYT